MPLRPPAPVLLCLLLATLSRRLEADAGHSTPVAATAAKPAIPTASVTAAPNAQSTVTPGAASSGGTLGTALTASKPSSSPAPTGASRLTTTTAGDATSNGATEPLTTGPTGTTLPTSQPHAAPSHAAQTSQSPSTQKTTLQPPLTPPRGNTLPAFSQRSPANTARSPDSGVSREGHAAASPEYSSVILPVVIALIVITLSVFALVGLYRLCRRTQPGAPENGNDQPPQSDRESVKLLTVKTISHEPGERPKGKN
ncbi:endomucin isoform X2 [Erinaceus europaeus]|uniref:Endomucin isoform X2 n=1 Tax=Erinaceus europaeus TaxID=9365 RepID=A0A1S3WSL5_ERIEU|nr:endomucin isoform X2 [Erinaceus europaeus]